MMNIEPFFFFMMGFNNFFVRNITLLLIVTLHLFLFLVVHRCHVKLFFFNLGQVHHEAYGVLLIDLSHFLLLECLGFVNLLKAVVFFVSLLNVICFSFLFFFLFVNEKCLMVTERKLLVCNEHV